MLALSDAKIVTKLTLAFMSLSAVTLGVSALSYTRLASIDQSSAQAVHSYAVLQSLDGVTTAMVNQETGVRGYLIGGDAKFLEPYKAGQTAFRENFERVTKLTSDNQAQQDRLGALKRAAEVWSNEVAAKEIRFVEGGNLEKAQALEASGAGKASMDALRAEAAEIAKTERGLLDLRSASQRSAFDTAYLTSIVGSVASVVIAILLSILVFGMIVRPLGRLGRLCKLM